MNSLEVIHTLDRSHIGVKKAKKYEHLHPSPLLLSVRRQSLLTSFLRTVFL